MPTKGIPMTAEHRAKIGAANRGKPRSPELRARLSAALAGRRRAPLKDGTKYNISDETKAKISATLTGRKLTSETRAKMSLGRQGRTHSDEYKQRMSVLHRALRDSGKIRPVYRHRYTKLAQALHRHLAASGVAVEPEVQFGRFVVDLYDRANHVAYEADGEYWHNRVKQKQPDFYVKRDQYLRDRFGLTVVRFAERDIRRMEAAA